MNSRTRVMTAGLMVAPAVLAGQSLTRQDAATDAQLIAVSAVSDRVVWASGSKGTWVRTTDGGATWTVGRVAGADSLAFRDVHAVSADTAWLLSIGKGDQSRIYRTSDGGRSWVLQYVAADPRMFLDCLAFWDGRRGLAVSDGVAGEFVVLSTEDGGAHWNRLPPDRFPQAREGEGFFASSGTCVATIGVRHTWLGTGAGKIARVLRSTDGGRSWRESSTPLVQNTATAGITTVAFRDTLHGVVAGGDVARNADSSANVAVTEDGGATWTLTAGLSGTVYAAAFVPGSSRLVVTGPSGAHLSHDGGRTFQRVSEDNHWGLAFSPQGVGWMVGPKGRITRIALDEGR